MTKFSNLTIRQHFAFGFAKIYLNHSKFDSYAVDSINAGVTCADELIKALNEEKEPEPAQDYSPKNIKQPHDSSCDCNDCIPF